MCVIWAKVDKVESLQTGLPLELSPPEPAEEEYRVTDTWHTIGPTEEPWDGIVQYPVLFGHTLELLVNTAYIYIYIYIY